MVTHTAWNLSSRFLYYEAKSTAYRSLSLHQAQFAGAYHLLEKKRYAAPMLPQSDNLEVQKLRTLYLKTLAQLHQDISQRITQFSQQKGVVPRVAVGLYDVVNACFIDQFQTVRNAQKCYEVLHGLEQDYAELYLSKEKDLCLFEVTFVKDILVDSAMCKDIDIRAMEIVFESKKRKLYM